MKTLVLAGLLLGAAGAMPADAATPPDSLSKLPAAPAAPWYRPRHLIAQVAGGVGMVSAGTGYACLGNHVETDVLLGYVPKQYAGSALTIATVKGMYSPFKAVKVARQVELLPVTLGAYASYTHGLLNAGEPGQYPDNYYWFLTKLRYGPLIGSRITYLGAPVAATGQPRKISFYYELGSNDLYLGSYFTNLNFSNWTSGLSITQLLTLGLGIKADF